MNHPGIRKAPPPPKATDDPSVFVACLRVGVIMQAVVLGCCALAVACRPDSERLGAALIVLGFFSIAVWVGTLAIAFPLLAARCLLGRRSGPAAKGPGPGGDWLDEPIG